MRFWLGLALFVCVALAGCADNNDRTDGNNNNNRFGGFYGGVSGGAEP